MVIFWEYSTIRHEYEKLSELVNDKKIINLNSRDISKKKVDEIFSKVFGYSSFVNPFENKGKCVKKSNLNGLHDGIIIECPYNGELEEGYVYQKLIDTVDNQNLTNEIRVSIIGNKIPYILLKHKKPDVRFGFGFYKSKLVDIKNYLSDDEISKILLFCKEMNLEFGELDILRDNSDKKYTL